jgi:hypothetical protein
LLDYLTGRGEPEFAARVMQTVMKSFDVITAVVFGISTLVAILCLPPLWRSSHSTLKRIIWTLILFIPVLGPVLYAGLFEPPPAKPKKEQPQFDPATRGWKS